MADWSTSWTPPAIPGGDPITTPAAPSTHDSTDWSWLTGDPTSSASAWSEWLGHIPADFQNLFAAFAPTPEQQLAEAIYQKMGPSTGPRSMRGTDPNLLLAQQAAHAAIQSPAYREQLATSMGWNAKNPHVAYWIQNGGGVPADPTGTGLAAGAVPSAGGAGAPGTTSTAVAGSPFDPKAWGGRAGDPGFTYGAVLPPGIAAAAGVARQWGVDYALPMGTQLPSIGAGTVIEAGFNGPYGNTVVVKLANQLTYRVAHLSAINAHVGQAVSTGTLLGLVGSTGNSTGPHVLIEMKDSQGKPIDPTPILDRLLKGDTVGGSGVMSDYVGATNANAPGGGNAVLTSDGHLMYPGSNDYNLFFAAQSLWRKRYGVDPPWSFLSALAASGQTTVEQVQNAMDMMTSDIPGMKWGQRDQLTSDVNGATGKAWSRPVPDSTVKQLAGEGITTPAQIDLWVKSHPASAIDNADRTAIFDQLAPGVSKYWDQPPSPEMVVQVHKLMNQGPS